MTELVLLLIFFWIPAQLVIWRNILWDLYIWQIKEYRFDRMISHILSQEEDLRQSKVIYALKVLSLATIVLYFFLPQLDFLLLSIALTFGLFFYESIITTEQALGKKLIRPKVSVRNIMILVASIGFLLIPFAIVMYFTLSLNVQYTEIINDFDLAKELSEVSLIPYTQGDIKVYPAATTALVFSTTFALMSDLLTPLVVSFFVFLTQPFALLKRRSIIEKGIQKINSVKNLKIIGITGSYGKTTTKELLSQILEKKFNVAKTLQNYNSAVGVAISAQKQIKSDTEIFVAEMGAYTVNEVKDATDVAKPDISIVTGIDSQHITLFKSTENIMKSKFEIIENAKDDAVAILNGDNEYTMRMAEMTSKKKIIYFTALDKTKIIKNDKSIKVGNNKFPTDNTIYAYDIKTGKEGIEFKIEFSGKVHSLKTNIRGEHFTSNVLACISACLVLDMKIDEIVKIINSTKFNLPYLNVLNGLNSSHIIDDGYNANSTGFLSALDELKKIKTDKKKHVFTKGIIELGWEKKNVYDKIADKLIKSSNTLITSDKELFEIVTKKDKEFKVVLVKNTDEFVKEFYRNIEEGDYVLLEGPMHPRFLSDVIDKD